MNKNRKDIDYLIADFLKKELNEKQLVELTDWLKEDKENKRYFDEYVEIWITNNVLSDKSTAYSPKKGFERFKGIVTNSTSEVKPT